MKKVSGKKLSYISIITLAFLVVGAAGTDARADGGGTTSITATVLSACTLSSAASGTGEGYDVSVLNGQYKDDIGVTEITAFCNTPETFSIYAVGYSGDTLGGTGLVSTSSAPAIATGTATSGNTSNWAMKVEAVAGTGLSGGLNNVTPAIEGGYENFSVIPSKQTKIASVSSITGNNNNITKVKTSYAVYVAPAQMTGTYVGKVRYTVVYPASNLPVGPVEAEPGTVSYSPNTNGVLDTMGNQTIGDTDTSITLWASNFKRAGYGFVGWSDKYDWVLNANDANGNGTGANAGYHIYGPNETITITAGQYSGSNNGLSLYAVWAPSAGTLQGWSGCNLMSVGEVTALTDNRDNDTYAVAKLADGNCWMTENMRLASNANNTINTANTVNNMTATDQNIYSYGNYYDWNNATSNTVCPAGWHMPTGNIGGEFSALDSILGGTGDIQNTVEASNRWRQYPRSFLMSGSYSIGGGGLIPSGVNSRGSIGDYWSSTENSSNNNISYGFSLRINYINSGVSETGKSVGLSIRCVANEPTTSLEQAYINAGKTKHNGYYKMQDMNSSICAAATAVDEESQMQAIDTRDNKLYWITKLQDGHCWMTQNLDLDLSNTTALTSDTTDLTSYGSGGYTTANGYSQQAIGGKNVISWTPIRGTIDASNVTNNSISGWSNSYTNPYSVDPGNWYWKNNPFYSSTSNNFLAGSAGDKFQKDTAYASNGEHGHVGNYYNWSAAVATNSTSGITASTYSNPANNPQNSICPAGWRLPTISNDTSASSNGSTNEFRRLNVLYNSNSTSSSQNLEKAPLYFVRAGNVNSGAQDDAGNYGYYWSSSVNSSSNAYYLYLYSSDVYPENYNTRYNGFSVRCVSR